MFFGGPDQMKILALNELERIPLDPSAIAMVPESVAHDSCLLPVSRDGSRQCLANHSYL